MGDSLGTPSSAGMGNNINAARRRVGNAEHLLGFGVVGNSKIVDQVDSIKVYIQIGTDHELTIDHFSFVGDGQGGDPVEAKIIVAGAL